MLDNKQKTLCEWLRNNSSGVYKPAATAADQIEQLQSKIDTQDRANVLLKATLDILTKCDESGYVKMPWSLPHNTMALNVMVLA